MHTKWGHKPSANIVSPSAFLIPASLNVGMLIQSASKDVMFHVMDFVDQINCVGAPHLVVLRSYGEIHCVHIAVKLGSIILKICQP